MESYILFIPALIIYIAVISIYFSHSQPKGNIWFGVTLPDEALQDEKMIQLRKEYRRAYGQFAVLALVAKLPLLWLGEIFSLAFIYVFLWLAGIMYTSTVPFKRIHYKAAKLKRDQNWFRTGKKTIRIDLEIALLTGKLPISPYWFILPALMSIPLTITAWNDGIGPLKLVGFASLAMTVVMFLLHLSFTRGKPRAHSRNPVPDKALNHAAKRYWSVLWLSLAVFEAINAFIAYTVFSKGISADPGLWLGGIFMVSLVPLIGIYLVHNHIKELEYRYGDTNGSSYPADDDEYWHHGLSYYNRKNKSVFVPKRVGVGTTLNMATRTGKLIYYGTFVLIAAIVVPIAIVVARADAAAPELLISDNGAVAIEDSGYPFSFSIDDVLDLTLEEQPPSGFRSNGIATADYARGNFTMNELGAAKLYIFKKNPPYILIKLKDEYVVYNERDPARTIELFAELQKRLIERD